MEIKTTDIRGAEFPRHEYNLLKHIPEKFAEAVKTMDGNVMLCGGAVTSVFTNQRIRDFDLYFSNAHVFGLVLAYMKKRKAEIVVQTDNAITLRWHGHKWQLIRCVFGTAAEIFNSFDFSICMGAYSLTHNVWTLHKDFLVHNAEKRLVFHNGTRYPLCSLIRTRKYASRGYTLTGVGYIEIALCVHALRINTYADLKFHLQGIDTAFLKPLTDELMKQGETHYDYDKCLHLMDNVLHKYFENLYHEATDAEDDAPVEA